MKKEYVAPELEDLGSLDELTQAGRLLFIRLDGDGGGWGGWGGGGGAGGGGGGSTFS